MKINCRTYFKFLGHSHARMLFIHSSAGIVRGSVSYIKPLLLRSLYVAERAEDLVDGSFSPTIIPLPLIDALRIHVAFAATSLSSKSGRSILLTIPLQDFLSPGAYLETQQARVYVSSLFESFASLTLFLGKPNHIIISYSYSYSMSSKTRSPYLRLTPFHSITTRVSTIMMVTNAAKRKEPLSHPRKERKKVLTLRGARMVPLTSYANPSCFPPTVASMRTS
jgi:hypothetical protein